VAAAGAVDATASQPDPPAVASVSFQGISKRYPGVHALDSVSFEVRAGACHALMGENGAGKSTLGKILAGVARADAGEIRLDGRAVNPIDPLAARALGIAMVHQELAFCPNLSIAENLCLGAMPQRAGWVDRAALREAARRMLGEVGADFDVSRPIAELTTGQEQLVQIAAAVGTGARVIVFDEPTSSLSAAESEHLFHLLGDLRRRGITVLYVSHRMEEIFRVCDAVTVLRDGRHVATGPVAETTPDQVVSRMIGRDLVRHEPEHLSRELGAVALEVRGLTSPGRFRDVSLTLRRGEVLGLAGLIGAGRSEVAQAVFGLDPEATGEVRVKGRPLEPGSVDAALKAGLGLLPEDRKRQGLVLPMNCRENATLAALRAVSRAGWIRRGPEQALAQRFADRLRVKTPTLEALISGLSGGNQQKIALAKWLARECDVLIVDEPTRGVDVGAKAEIHRLLDELACEGLALLVISSDLPELTALCRRLIVLRSGRMAGELTRDQFDPAQILRRMAGLETA
jgi:ABC-type sugar transport system ATPase subunit